LKYAIEFCFTLFLTIFFQVYIVGFNHYLHEAQIEVSMMMEQRAAGMKNTDLYIHEVELLHSELSHAATELFDSMLISCI
jgi:hypothetical protein